MFKFLKEKLKGWFRKSEEKAEEVVEKEIKQEVKIEETKKEIEKKSIEAEFEKQEKKPEEPETKPEEKKSLISRIKSKFKFKMSEDYFDEIFSDLEFMLLENNVALEVVEKLKKDLKKELLGLEIKKEQVEEKIKEALKISIESLFVEELDLIKKIKSKKDKPFVILFFGINGSGKTTTIAKIAYLLQKNNLSVVFAAADTFRAASIEQLEKHGNNLKIKTIKSQYNADPASVAFDAIKYAKAHYIDTVLIDTAGRMYTKLDLMKEMDKISRISKADLKIFVGESITGNDATVQAKTFNDTIGIDSIILAKADVDEKSGTVLSVSYVTGKPILYLGTGQKYPDLEIFNKDKIIKQLGLD